MSQFRISTRSDSSPDAAPTFVKVIIFAWVLVVASENLKTQYLPYADWLATVPALACLLLYGRPSLTFAQIIFLTSIAIGGFIGGDVLHAAVWCVKLTVIFLCTSCLATAPGLPKVAFLALVALMACNLLMLVLGLLGMSTLSEMMGAQGRYGTLLCHPGALWHVGMAPLVYFACLSLMGGKRFLWALPAMAACVAVIWFDGSRTGFIIVIGYCLVPTVKYLKRTPHLAVGLIILTLLLVPILSVREVSEEGPLYRTVRLFQESSSCSEALEAWDPTRYQMYRQSMELIANAPLLGNGFDAATIQLDDDVNLDDETMVVHDAYLQVWGNFGLAGIVALVSLIWGWTAAGMNSYRATLTCGIKDRAQAINTVSMLLTFGIALLFHPLSTAWSDWILFTIPTAMLAQPPGWAPRGAAQGIATTLKWAIP